MDHTYTKWKNVSYVNPNPQPMDYSSRYPSSYEGYYYTDYVGPHSSFGLQPNPTWETQPEPYDHQLHQGPIPSYSSSPQPSTEYHNQSMYTELDLKNKCMELWEMCQKLGDEIKKYGDDMAKGLEETKCRFAEFYGHQSTDTYNVFTQEQNPDYAINDLDMAWDDLEHTLSNETKLEGDFHSQSEGTFDGLHDAPCSRGERRQLEDLNDDLSRKFDLENQFLQPLDLEPDYLQTTDMISRQPHGDYGFYHSDSMTPEWHEPNDDHKDNLEAETCDESHDFNDPPPNEIVIEMSISSTNLLNSYLKRCIDDESEEYEDDDDESEDDFVDFEEESESEFNEDEVEEKFDLKINDDESEDDVDIEYESGDYQEPMVKENLKDDFYEESTNKMNLEDCCENENFVEVIVEEKTAIALEKEYEDEFPIDFEKIENAELEKECDTEMTDPPDSNTPLIPPWSGPFFESDKLYPVHPPWVEKSLSSLDSAFSFIVPIPIYGEYYILPVLIIHHMDHNHYHLSTIILQPALAQHRGFLNTDAALARDTGYS